MEKNRLVSHKIDHQLQRCLKSQIVLLLVLTFLFAISAKAEMHMWTDKNGKVHYTNTTPPQQANNVTSSKEIVESPELKSNRLEREQRETELQRIENDRKKGLRKRKREIERRTQAEIRRINRDTEQKIEAIKRSGEGVYLHDKDVVCRSSSDAGSYNYHTYNNNPLNVADLFAERRCWKIKGTKDVTWISSKTDKHVHGTSVKFCYWHEGRKITAHTSPYNVK